MSEFESSVRDTWTPVSSIPDVTRRRVVDLPTGQLTIIVYNSDKPLEQICRFAARQNPNRGFIFVSPVLGKHIPVKPSVAREVQTLLAGRIPEDLPGPVVVVGMAETAICLGNGVFDEYVRLTGRRDVMFTRSTRYRVDKPFAVEFIEEHSHAADHIIYEPHDEELKAMFYGCRSLVLIDDETSTGKTFVNLAKNMITVMPHVERIVTGVITDWRGPARTAATLSAMPVPAETVAILQGEYQFAPAPELKLVAMPKVTGTGELKDHLLVHNFGRLGLGAAQTCGDSQIEELVQNLLSALDRPLASIGTEKILVLGTGEFAYPPFLLAEKLEAAGFDVRYQSTTRSPIMHGLAIECGITHTDNYGDGIVNFLYNARPDDYGCVLLCHETPRSYLDDTLVSALGAETVEFFYARK